MTEYRFDARIEREPSCEVMVLCRLTGMVDVADEFEVRDDVCSIETAMLCLCCGGPMVCWRSRAQLRRRRYAAEQREKCAL